MPEGGLFGTVFARGPGVVDDAAWLRALLEVEAGLARALESAGLAPAGSGEAVTAVATPEHFDITTIGELSPLTGNPVPGLARELARAVGMPAARAVHRGATSQDVMDTAMMLLARQSIDAALADLATAADAAAGLTAAHRDTLMIGRTLLQQAVPVTFGLVAAGWLDGLDEARRDLITARSRLAVQFGGAAGTLASLGSDGPRVAGLLAAELGLGSAILPWHTQRLRISDVVMSMAKITAVLGKIARDVTLLAQTEVGEVVEGGGPSPSAGSAAGAAGAPRRGGSSAMPNKRNPVASIAILGCARQVPGLVATVLASAEAELQRAAGAWHAEWLPFAQVLTLASTAAAWGAELLPGLTPDAGRMAANLTATEGLPMAEHVTAVLAGVLGGPEAHDLVAEASERAVASGLPLRDVLLSVGDLESRLAQAGIAAGQIEAALDPTGYLGAAQTFIDAALAAHEQMGHDRG
jgi:3-carboxy-cis,cis-muconate cycloisomerase